MKIAKKLLAILALVPAMALASEGGFPLDKAPDRQTNMAALQHGAKLFVNYCLNCHSAVSMRYNRLRDLGLTEDQIKQNLLFTSDKVGDLMTTSLAAAGRQGLLWRRTAGFVGNFAREIIFRWHRRRLPVYLPAYVL